MGGGGFMHPERAGMQHHMPPNRGRGQSFLPPGRVPPTFAAQPVYLPPGRAHPYGGPHAPPTHPPQQPGPFFCPPPGPQPPNSGFRPVMQPPPANIPMALPKPMDLGMGSPPKPKLKFKIGAEEVAHQRVKIAASEAIKASQEMSPAIEEKQEDAAATPDFSKILNALKEVQTPPNSPPKPLAASAPTAPLPAAFPTRKPPPAPLTPLEYKLPTSPAQEKLLLHVIGAVKKCLKEHPTLDKKIFKFICKHAAGNIFTRLLQKKNLSNPSRMVNSRMGKIRSLVEQEVAKAVMR